MRGRNGGPNEFNSYIWVIDAHPEDIAMVDYVKPNGQKVMRTIAPFYLSLTAALMIVTYVPAFSMWLPRLAGYAR